MTIGSTTVATSGSTGNGVTTTFSFSFSVEAYGAVSQASQIEVIKQTIATGSETILTLTTDYTTSFNADQNASPGGSITMVTAPSSSFKIFIRMSPSFLQATDYQSQGGFLMETVEDQDDQIVRGLLTLKDMLRRAPVLSTPAGSSFDGKITGPFTPGYGLKVKSDGLGFDLGALTSATVGAAMTSFVSSGQFTATGATSALDFFGWAALSGLWPEQFGAVGDGATDDAVALAAWLTAVQASDSRRGFMKSKTYATSAALSITTNGVNILCVGPSSSHDVGTSPTGTVLKAITNTGFVGLTVAPVEGASAQRLEAVRIIGLTINANSRMTKGLLIKSAFRSEFDVTVFEATTSGVELGVATTLGEAADIQRNLFRITGRQYTNSAPILRLTGSSTANTSFNVFQYVDAAHYNGSAIICEDSDNNEWLSVRCVNAGGSATYSIEFRGGSSAAQSCRAEHIQLLSATKAAYVGGFTSYTEPAKDIRIENLDTGNGTPDPTVEPGGTISWGNNHSDDAYGPNRYNLVVNGDMALNQLAPSTNADKSAGFDGGVVLTQSNSIALTSVSAPENGQAQCLRMTQSNASAQRMGYLFVIPSEDTIPLRGKGVALAARIRQSTGSVNVRCSISEWTGTADAAAGDIVADWTSSTYTTAGFFTSTTHTLLATMATAVAANTWRDLSGSQNTGGGLTANVSSSANNLLVFIWTEATVAQNVTLDIGQVRLIAGFMPTPNVRESRDVTISRAQRQVEKSYDIGVAPGSSSATGSVGFVSRKADQLDRISVPFRTRKIATAPTITLYSTTGASAKFRNITGGSDLAAAVENNGDSGFAALATANTTIDNDYAFQWTAAKYPWT